MTDTEDSGDDDVDDDDDDDDDGASTEMEVTNEVYAYVQSLSCCHKRIAIKKKAPVLLLGCVFLLE